ncbi:hypothetical protein [Paenibacillus planticolens]|uniref:Uncharacterized protein n=1 Tax=Paenibacillus planticolens TaxID=2654976 RepID=A0ABX1ZGZ8_9BACL|nr:hypothetical protein [Paenibacillus planticolens]NOU98687.1 hypothetical protein [Paenibacillus planticolens]
MKKISLVFLISISLFIIYQFQKPVLTEDIAIIKAKEYIQVINKKMNVDIDTQKSAEYCVLTKDTVWNKIIGNTQWSVMIDGYSVDIQANTGEFVRVIGPLDGVISELPK